MKTKTKLIALIFALLCMAIILMPSNVFAANVSTESELRTALETNEDANIVLTGNFSIKGTTSIDVNRTPKPGMVIQNSVTIDGAGHTITSAGLRTIFEVYAGDEILNVTFKNITIENPYTKGRCIDTRTGNINMLLENVTLKTTSSNNNQALTIGGNYKNPITVNLKGSTLDAGSAGYGIVTYNPVLLNVNEDTKINGYAALYIKGEDGSNGSEGSIITIDSSELNGLGHKEEKFGVIDLEDNNLTINITDSIISANVPKDSEYKAINWGPLDSKLKEIEVEVDGEIQKVKVPVQVVEGNIITISGKSEMKFTGEGPLEIADLGTENTFVAEEGVISNTKIPEEFLPTGAECRKENGKYVVYVPHDVVVNKDEGGTVTVDKVSALEGETVTLTVTPNKGYKLSKLTVNGKEVVDGKFTMPNEDAKVEAVFEKISYAVKVEEPTNGKVTASVEKALEGETVTLTVTPNKGYKLSKLTVNGKEVVDGKFTMPNEDAKVEAVFEKISYAVKVEEPTNGKVTASVEKAVEGETVTLTVTPNTGYELSKLTVNGKEVIDGKFTMPAEEVTVVAEFKKIPVVDIVVPEDKTENNNLGVVETEELKETLGTSLKADTELNKKVEEAKQNGEDVVVEIKVEELDKESVNKEEKQQILQTVAANQKVHQYFDISVLVKTEKEELGKITQLTDKMKFSMEISKDLIQEGRKFFILKLHGDKVERIETVLNGTKLEFETDQFSTFALAYEDVETSSGVPGEPQPPTEENDDVPPVSEEKDDTPKTGAINIPVYVWITIAGMAIVGIVTTKKSSKHSR